MTKLVLLHLVRWALSLGPHGTPAFTQIPVRVYPLEALVGDHEPGLKCTPGDSVRRALPFITCRMGSLHSNFEDHPSLNEAMTLKKNRWCHEVFNTKTHGFVNTRKCPHWGMSASSTEIVGMSHRNIGGKEADYA